MSAHEAPARSVVYSKEHCKSSSPRERASRLTKNFSITRLSIMGLNSPFPRPQEPRKSAYSHQTPSQTSLPLNHPFQTSCCHELPPRLHLRHAEHIDAIISKQRSPHRVKTLATTRIFLKVHDQSCGLYAER